MRFTLLTLLCASLAANAYIFLRAPSSNPAFPASPGPISSTTPFASLSPQPEAAAAASSPTHLLAFLRSQGLPEATVNSLMRAHLYEKYYARYREIYAAKKPANASAYWNNGTRGARALTSEERAELRELQRSARTEIAALLGPNAHDPAGYYDLKYDYLSPDKAGQLYQLQRDYDDMRSQLNDDTNNYRVASDAEKLNFLTAEYRKDLASILTPEELRAHDLRHSFTASSLMRSAQGLNLSESEYTQIYDLRSKMDQAFKEVRDLSTKTTDGKTTRYTLNPDSKDTYAAIKAEREKLQDQINTLLGPDRLATYQRNQDFDYTQLRKAQERFNLPEAAIEQTYALREATGSASMRIANDTTLTPEQKTAALNQLAVETRNKIKTNLGGEIADAYLANDSTLRWLKQYIEKGQAIEYTSPTSYRIKSVVPSTSRPKTK